MGALDPQGDLCVSRSAWQANKSLSSLLYGTRSITGACLLIRGDHTSTKLCDPNNLATATGSVTGGSGELGDFASFDLAVPRMFTAFTVWCRCKIEMVASFTTGTGGAKLSVERVRNGSATVLATNQGTARDLTAAAATTYVELLAAHIPATEWACGDKLRFRFALNMDSAGSGTGNVKIHHDPATSGNELLVEVLA